MPTADPGPLWKGTKPRNRSDRCFWCDRRIHGRCEGGECSCPSVRCDGKPWRKEPEVEPDCL